jgi:hypothetical protein
MMALDFFRHVLQLQLHSHNVDASALKDPKLKRLHSGQRVHLGLRVIQLVRVKFIIAKDTEIKQVTGQLDSELPCVNLLNKELLAAGLVLDLREFDQTDEQDYANNRGGKNNHGLVDFVVDATVFTFWLKGSNWVALQRDRKSCQDQRCNHQNNLRHKNTADCVFYL